MSEHEERYLIMVTTANNNKFYRMIPKDDGTFDVNYGRVGEAGQMAHYPMSKWDTKYREKIRKGYIDQTDLHKVKKTKEEKKADAEPTYKPLSDKVLEEVMDFLISCAQHTIQQNYKVSSTEVTQAMVDRAQVVISKMTRVANDVNRPAAARVAEMNQLLLELFAVIPRRMHSVNDYLTSKVDDFAQTLKNEQDLLDVMASQVIVEEDEPEGEEESKPDEVENKPTILESLGLTARAVKPAEEKKIKELLGGESGLYYNAWAIENKKTQERYDKYMDGHRTASGRKMRTKLLWHGSKNENWISILKTGLMLRPNAAVTGKMFGSGLYFAPLAKKSLGYTSLNGSYWARGGSDRAFMAVFETAYGKPLNVDDCNKFFYDFGAKNLEQLDATANCVHAHAGRALYNDEIIYYREDQVTVKYLVELRRH